MDLLAMFNKFEDEYLKFERISEPRHVRPDIAAFVLLHSLVPGASDIVAAAEHDQIWLDTDPEELAKVATEADVLELVRCGVMFDGDGLSMFA